MIFNRMNKFIICFAILAAALFSLNLNCFAAERKIPTVVVLSDTNHRNGTTYLICGAASDIIASDIINKLNQTGRIKAPLLGENMSRVTQNLSLYSVTFFRDYKYNYNVDFVNLKRLTRNIQTDYILMVTSGLDIQSEFLKETWWTKWGISSSEPIVPTYRLVTMLTLIDKSTYSVVWQNLYERDIKANNMDIGITQFSPNYSQLAKIKKYSNTMSEYVVNSVDKVVNPWILPHQEPKSLEMKSKFLNEGTKLYYPSVNGEVVRQNFDEAKQNHQIKRDIKKREREQKKYIENVRLLEQKKQADEIRELEQKINTQNTKKQKNKGDERLFDSIRNNIDDVTNTLPEPKEETREYIPAVEIQPDQNIKPAVIKGINSQTNNEKPASYQKQQPESQPQTNPKELSPKSPQNIPPKLPNYDWNLKNIYLQKIGQISYW